MAEQTPQLNQSQRIDDIEKAHTMALEGHQNRTWAAEARESAGHKELMLQEELKAEEEDIDPAPVWAPSPHELREEVRQVSEDAEYYDSEAKTAEEEAGRQYDAENSRG